MGRRETVHGSSPQRSSDGGKNLVGKFTQSVRRIVQDVKDDGPPSGMSRENIILTNERVRLTRVRLGASYDKTKQTLITLMNKYHDAKRTWNILTRYTLRKAMAKEAISLEKCYWTLMEFPKQEKLETVTCYVMRACAIVERSQKTGDGMRTSAKITEDVLERKARIERLDIMTTTLIEAENTQMINDLYRLLKKYIALRNLMGQLKNDYESAKSYPIIVRYSMIRNMIKGVITDPEFIEVCHEA